ncbi:hypothetical protein IW262DRAFT_411713 [Armillaria fumosa]|nr:hypothetical protein IW262DRAFT_411713 [Armillaria fumosa]
MKKSRATDVEANFGQNFSTSDFEPELHLNAASWLQYLRRDGYFAHSRQICSLRPFTSLLTRIYNLVSRKHIGVSPSPGQCCNEDVLKVIFSLLNRYDLRSISLVYHSWFIVAYDLLYTYVEFNPDTFGPPTFFSHLALSQTLIQSNRVRGLIRHLKVGYHEHIGLPDDVYDWLLLLPHNTILSLEVCNIGTGDELLVSKLVRSPMLRSIHYFYHCGVHTFFANGIRLSSFLASSPRLCRLRLAHPPSSDVHKFSTLHYVSTAITHLHISSYEPSGMLYVLLKVLGPQLHFLHCRIADARVSADTLQDALGFLGLQLEQLIIHFDLPPQYPFCDDIPQRCLNLRDLYCGRRSFSALPQSLERLALESLAPLPVNAVWQFLSDCRNSHPSMSRLTIYASSRLGFLQDVCEDNGIEFECYPGFAPVWKSSAARMWPMKSLFDTP